MVETVLKSLQPVVEALRNLQQREGSPWVQEAMTAALASRSAVVEAAKPYAQHAPGLGAVLSDIWITDVSGGTSAQGPVLETLTGKVPPVPPGTMWPMHPPKKEDDEEQ